ncbi:hypothetical protein OY671_008452, partial [Metschnikowia pulcherrima]
MSAERDPAIARFAISQSVRLSGTSSVSAGALVASRKVGWSAGSPEAAGYVSMVAASAEPRMKRFYKDVTVVAEDGGFRVVSDGRGIRTVGGRPQIVPARASAEAMAAEWADQGDEIDSTRFHSRDMADFASDVVAPERARTIGESSPYAETDTSCYRAEPDEPSAARQRAVWEPSLSAMETRIGVSFHRVSGVMHPPQPPEALERIAGESEGSDAFASAASRNTASLAA